MTADIDDGVSQLDKIQAMSKFAKELQPSSTRSRFERNRRAIMKHWKWILVASFVCGVLELMIQGGCIGEHVSEPVAKVGSPRPEMVIPEGKGYTPRACGLDMNRNGVIGEPADRLVADGKTSDPDGDGIDEDIIYVCSETGANWPNDGSIDQPVRTIQYALEIADGPEDGAEDIICISGTFNESIHLIKGGVPGHYERDGFQFPKNPTMIVGWDRDGDGEYPPYDKDDIAVLDGQNRLDMAITNRPNKISYFELAHLTITNYGRQPDNVTLDQMDRGAIRLSGIGSGEQSHLYIHDVEFQGVNKSAPSESATIVVSFWSRKNTLRHVAFINNLVNEFSSYCFRGAPHNGSGHFRFQNNTFKFYGVTDPNLAETAFSYAAVAKMWSNHSNVEYIDNVIDGNPRAWRPKGYLSGIRSGHGTENYTIRGNVLIDLGTPISVKGYAGRQFVYTHPSNNLRIDRNIIVNTYDDFRKPVKGILIMAGRTQNATVADVAITNNVFYSSSEWNAIRCHAANNEGPQPGTITITGNTFYGAFDSDEFAHIYINPGRRKFPQNNFVVTNNVFANGGGEHPNVIASYAPSNWSAGGNVYDTGGFIWAGEKIQTLSQWQQTTVADADSEQATRAIENPLSGRAPPSQPGRTPGSTRRRR